jgi:hypothetical protein
MKGMLRSLLIAAFAALVLLSACNPKDDAAGYTVTFSPGEGSGPVPESRRVSAGSLMTLPGQGGMSPPEDKIFDGWEARGRVYPEGEKVGINADVLFTARWIEAPIEAGKGYVRFINGGQFPVSISKDPGRAVELALVPASGRKRVEVEPVPTGNTFYPRFLITLDGIPVFTQDEEAITVRVDVGKVTDVQVPGITAVSGSAACVRLVNQSGSSLTFSRDGYEQRPLSADPAVGLSTIVMPQETALYVVRIGDISGCAVMKNTTAPVAFPAVIQEFQAGGVYTFRFDGSALILTGISDVFGEPFPLGVSVSTAAEMEEVLESTEGLARIDLAVAGDFSLGAVSLSAGERTLRISGGQAGEKTITLSGAGSLFTVNSGVILILGDNLTLRGLPGNSDSLVRVESGGTLTMNEGAKLTGNAAPHGGGVYVAGGGFALNGGEISGNASSLAGGGRRGIYRRGRCWTWGVCGDFPHQGTGYYGGFGDYIGQLQRRRGGRLGANHRTFHLVPWGILNLD